MIEITVHKVLRQTDGTDITNGERLLIDAAQPPFSKISQN